MWEKDSFYGFTLRSELKALRNCSVDKADPGRVYIYDLIRFRLNVSNRYRQYRTEFFGLNFTDLDQTEPYYRDESYLYTDDVMLGDGKTNWSPVMHSQNLSTV
jgi:hypothetical protein